MTNLWGSSGTDYLGAVKKFEGFTPTASWDYRQHSNGYGTKARFPGETIDRDEAERRFASEWDEARRYVLALRQDLTPGQEAALTSLTFNAGPGWIKAGLGEAVRRGDWTDATNRFSQYTRAGGQVLPGLVNRRAAEAAWLSEAAPQGGQMPGMSDMDATPVAYNPTQPSAGATMPTKTTTIKTPTVSVGAAKKGTSAYRAAVAQALMNNKLSANPTAFEGITNAIGKGVGAYGMMSMANAEDEKQALERKLAAEALAGDPVLSQWAAIDPKGAMQGYIADQRNASAEMRADKRSKEAAKVAEDRADQRLRVQNAADAARMERLQKVEEERLARQTQAEQERLRRESEMATRRHALEAAAAANDPKNWKFTTQGARETHTNLLTGATRVYRGGVLESETPGKAPTVPMPGMPNGLPIGTGAPAASEAPPAATPPGMPPGATPAVNTGAPELTPTQATPPTSTPTPPTSTPTPLTEESEIPGFGLNKDGTKYVSPLGYEYGRKSKDGSVAPSFLFGAPYMSAQREEDYKIEYDLAAKGSEARKGVIDKSYAAARSQVATLDRADTALRNGTDAGSFARPIQIVKRALSSAGVDVQGMTDNAILEAASVKLVPAMREGLPGAVSNFEMEQYLKGVVQLGNTPEANMLLSHFMRKSAQVAETDRKLMKEYLDLKQKYDQPRHLDDGFRTYADNYYDKNHIFDDKDRRLMELASKGVRVKDLMKFRDSGEEPEERPARSSRPRVSRDGTVPPAPAPPPAPAATPAATPDAPEDAIPEGLPDPATLIGKTIVGPGGRRLRADANGWRWVK